MTSIIKSIHNSTQEFIPLFVLITFLLLLLFIYINRKFIFSIIKEIDTKTWVFLVVIFFLTLLVRVYIPPHHHVTYVDEPWIMKAGKDMLQHNSIAWYPASIGWPFLLTIAFSLFGISNWVAIYATIFLGSMTVFTLFFLTYIITKNQYVSLASALIFPLFAGHIRFSATAANNIPSIFFITLTLFFCFLYYRKKTWSLLWLSLISLAYTAQIRPENHLFPIIFLFGIFLFNKKSIKFNFKFIAPWIVFSILIIPNFFNVFNEKLAADWIAEDLKTELQGKNFSFDNLSYNSKKFNKYFYNTKFQPLLFTVLFIMGFFYLFHNKRKESIFLLFWFLLVWFGYFFAWFHSFGADPALEPKTRFFISFYPITSIFAAYGIFFISDRFPSKKKIFKHIIFLLVTLVLAALFIPYSLEASTLFSDKGHKLETTIPEKAEKDIPSNCIIISHLPSILTSTTNLNVVDIRDMLNNPLLEKETVEENECVLFFDDYTCLDWAPVFKPECETMKAKYNMAPFISYQEGTKNYTFYKIESKK